MSKECYLCHSKNVHLMSNATFEDVGYFVEGIVSFYECPDCGAMIEVSMAEYELNNSREVTDNEEREIDSD